MLKTGNSLIQLCVSIRHLVQEFSDVFPEFFPDRWSVAVSAIVKDQFGIWNMFFHLKGVFDWNNIVPSCRG